MKKIQSVTTARVLLAGAALWGSQLFAFATSTMSWVPNNQTVPLSTTSLMAMAAIMLIAATWMLLKKQKQLPMLMLAGVLAAGGYLYQAKANGYAYIADQCSGTNVDVAYAYVFQNACGHEIRITEINRICPTPAANPCATGTVLTDSATCNICEDIPY